MRQQIKQLPKCPERCAKTRSEWIKAIEDARTELGEATRLIRDIPAHGKVTMWKARENDDKSPRLVYDYRIVNAMRGDKTSFILLNRGTTLMRHVWFWRVKIYIAFPERSELMINQSHQDEYPTVLRFHTPSACTTVAQLLQDKFDPFGHVARPLPMAHPKWPSERMMMERTEEMCQLELGKHICNLENIYSRIRTILRFEFGDENYNNENMKRNVKNIWRFYFNAYDNRRVRDERMRISPAKHARRRRSILNSTLTSDNHLFCSRDVPVGVKLERVFGYDSSSSKTWSRQRSRYEVAGRVRLYVLFSSFF